MWVMVLQGFRREGWRACLLVGGLYLKRGLKNKVRLTLMTIMFYVHFKDKYIAYHLRPGNPLKSCPKEVI